MPSLGKRMSPIPSALALALVTIAGGVLLSRSYGEQRGYPTDSDQDLLAFGAANVAAGLSMSFSVGSSTSRTAAMDQLGSRTQLPSMIMAGGALLLLLFGTAALAQISSPVIGAVVAASVRRTSSASAHGSACRCGMRWTRRIDGGPNGIIHNERF